MSVILQRLQNPSVGWESYGIKGIILDMDFAVGHEIIINGQAYIIRSKETVIMKYSSLNNTVSLAVGYMLINSAGRMKVALSKLGFSSVKQFTSVYFFQLQASGSQIERTYQYYNFTFQTLV